MHEPPQKDEATRNVRIYIMCILSFCSLLHFWAVKDIYLRASRSLAAMLLNFLQ